MKQRHKPLLAHTGIRGRRREHLVENQLYRSSSGEGSIYGKSIGRLARRGPREGRKNGRKDAIGQRSQGACPSSGIDTVQAGLAFSKDRFDIGRFRALQHAVAEFIASDQGVAYERVENWIALDSHYPTPKLDVRALILDSQQRVLLVREASDSRWTLPGGWCDVNESPADAVVRETQEESGLEVRAIRLLALLDKHKHPHPPQLPHALKAFFFCHVTGGSLQQQTDETSAAEYFPVDALPPLSEHRVLASQIQTLWQRIHAETPEALFD